MCKSHPLKQTYDPHRHNFHVTILNYFYIKCKQIYGIFNNLANIIVHSLFSSDPIPK